MAAALSCTLLNAPFFNFYPTVAGLFLPVYKRVVVLLSNT